MRTEGLLLVAWFGLWSSVAAASPKAGPKASTNTTKAVDAELAKFTVNSPLGKADRVNGYEVKHMVAFTFDDGPNPETTPGVLDTLEKYDIPATFFIVTQRLLGKHGEQPRALITRMLAEGFTIGSHTTSHMNLRGKSAAKLVSEIDNSLRVLHDTAQQPIGLFRAPYGAMDKSSRAWIKARGLTEVFWSVDTLDWKAKNGPKLRAKVMKMILAEDGGIVLMHDIHALTASVVPGVLDDLEAENCRRLTAKDKDPIIPVSIHYFLRDAKQAREIPADVKARTAKYIAELPGRCAKRPAGPPAAAAETK